MITVKCDNCGMEIAVPESVQGRRGMCFGCGATLIVPGEMIDASKLTLDFERGVRISDRYLIEWPVGKGGMGVVYRAEDTLLDEAVALKFMDPRLLRSQRGQKLFITEAQVARRLRHENIVAVHDVASTPEGIMYLSMEFLAGKSLRSHLREHRRERRLVDVRLAVSIMSQVLAALDYAHRYVVHRDIKPENIMLLPGEQVKVLDFGLAKAVDVQEEGEQKTKRVVGTEAYAAPEQKRQLEIDGRCDIYAAGLILHELFTLRTPIDEQVTVAQVRSDVSPSLFEVLDKALREERGDRWQDAGAFRKALLSAFDASYRAVEVAEVQVGEKRTVSTEGMVYLEGGSFLMGNASPPQCAPEFEAEVEPFYMDKHPVTREQYAAYLEATGAAPPKFWNEPELSGADQPVVGVTWAEANAYAAWAGKQLPSEAQWEFAARGKENRRYPWGTQELDPMRCNYGDNLNTPSIVTMHDDGATPEGLLDMAGNVYEWTRDPYAPYDPRLRGKARPSKEPRKAARGGSWNSKPEELRTWQRAGFFPETQSKTIGFRCVVAAEHANG